MRRLCTLRQGVVLVSMGILSLLIAHNLAAKSNSAFLFSPPIFIDDTTYQVGPASCEVDLELSHPGFTNDACGNPITIMLRLDNINIANDSLIGNYETGVYIIEWIYMYDPNATSCLPDTLVQKLIIEDGIPPSLTVIPDVTTDCDSDDEAPFADFSEYIAAGGGASDNCEIDTTSFAFVDENSDGGFNPETVTRRYRIADVSGNYDTVEHVVIVEDNTTPDINCLDDMVGISFGNPDSVHFSSFLNSTSDACGGPLEVQIARMDEGIFRDSAYFTCEDVGNIVMVVLEVTDESGNTNTCMAEADVRDFIAPLVMLGLPDITVSCSYDIDTTDMSEFGIFDINAFTPTPIIIDDPELDPNGPREVGNNGMIQENCPDGLDFAEVIIDERDCGTGNITRIFTITDQFGNSVETDQVITVVDPSPFSIDDISWPDMVIFDNCSLFTSDTSVTGRPLLNITDICSMPTMVMNDLYYDEPNSGCIVLERTWKVIDWCNYDKANNIGIWEHIQYIKSTNSVAPVFIDQSTTIERCAPGAGCDGNFTFENTANDDCTDSLDILISYAYDIDNDGSIDGSGDGRVFSVDLTQGTHRIIWSAFDQCGNESLQEQLIEVNECKTPTPVCLHGVAISLSSMGMVEIWASDFNNHSYDNCTTPEDLIYSFSTDTLDKSLPLTCDDIGEVVVEMWVTDTNGNQAFCVTYIDVQDSHGICPANADEGSEEEKTAMIAGTVFTVYETAIPETQVNISGPEYETYQMTDDIGKYTFEKLPMHYNYEVIPVKDDNPMDGVTTLDLVKIQRHILGLKTFDSPFQLIASDVNNSEHVTAADLIQLRKLILGIYDNFPENNSWRFVEKQYGLIGQSDPWPFLEGMMVPDLSNPMVEGHFIGVKIGDVDNSIEEKLTSRNIQPRSSEDLTIRLKDELLSAGQTKEIAITVDNTVDLIGLQWTLSFDDTKMQLVDWKMEDLEVSDDQVAIRSGEGEHLSLAWTSLDGSHLRSGSSILRVKVKALEDLQLSEVLHLGSTITAAAAYNVSEERMEVQVAWDRLEAGGIELYQNAPNPFIDHTYISFQLPRDMQAEVTISDISGRVAFRQKGFFNAGKNTILVGSEEMNVKPGVVYYNLRTEETSITKKMIYLK